MPKKKNKSVGSKKKLKDLSETDGMAREDKFVPSTLDQVFGDDGTDVYKTLDRGVYEKVLDNMSKSDLKHEAIRVGLLPIDNMQQLRARLSREFTVHVNSYQRPSSTSDKVTLSEESIKILREGQ